MPIEIFNRLECMLYYVYSSDHTKKALMKVLVMDLKPLACWSFPQVVTTTTLPHPGFNSGTVALISEIYAIMTQSLLIVPQLVKMVDTAVHTSDRRLSRSVRLT